MSALDDLKAALKLLDGAKRTIIVPPHAEAMVREGIDKRGLGGFYTVVSSQSCPDGQLFICDEKALQHAYSVAADSGVGGVQSK